MFKRKLLKQSKLRRLLLKILNVHAIDKETFNLVNPHTNNEGKNFFELNKKTYILSNGYLDLKRKIKKLDIYYRFTPSIDLWNTKGSWKRIIPNIDKETLIKVSLLSLKRSILFFLKNNNLKITLNLVHDQSNDKFNNDLKNLLLDDNYQIEFHNSKIKGNRGSYLECCDQCENSEDLIFFIEDDYLFNENCIDEMLITYARISTLIEKDIFLCPSDYAFYYDSNYSTSIYIGKNHRWRIVNETLLTFLFSKSILNKFRQNIRLVGERENSPFEKPLHEIFDQIPCLAPIKSTSYHLSRTVPGIESEWLDLWKKNYNEIYGGP